jgi:maleate cis-trans isomerase
MDMSEQKYIWGFVGPVAGSSEGRVDDRPQPLLPSNIVEISAGLGISDYTPEGVEEAIVRYWDCVETLKQQGARRIVLGGVPISSQLGRPRVLQLIEQTKAKAGLPADSTNEAMIAALAFLGIDQVAIASRWAEQLNQAMCNYLALAGIDIGAVTSEGQWAQEAFGMSIERGFVLAMQLGREAMRRAPRARALILPGGTWRSLAAVPLLGEEFGVPVLTNGVVTAWRFIDEGLAPPAKGWGRLLAIGPRGV